MRLIYDERAGAAYLCLREDSDEVGKVTSETFRPPGAIAGDDYLLLDFDSEGRLVGIEFLTPEERLLPSMLDGADRGRPRQG